MTAPPKMPTSKKFPRINLETLRLYLKEPVTVVLDIPPIKWPMWLLRSIPMTTGIVLLLCSIHGFAGLEGDIEGIRATWGHDPGKPFSWLTHAFLHTDNWHLPLNVVVFWTSGGLVELYLGRTKLDIITIFTAVAAAVMSGIAVPEYWHTNSNPIGFSAVAQATFALGVYSGSTWEGK